MRRLLNRRNGALLAAALVVVAFFSFRSGDGRNFQIAKNLSTFNSIVKELDTFCVDTLDPNKMVREGTDYILSSLDPRIEHYPEDGRAELQQVLNTLLEGIGPLTTYNQKLERSMITEPFERAPVVEIGLEAGGILIGADGKDLAEKNNQEVSRVLRGAVGTNFKLKVKRPSGKDGARPLGFNVVRQTIRTPMTFYDTISNESMGYTNLSTFSGTSSKDFEKTSLRLKKEGITSLMTDLCGNSGGRLGEAIEIANFSLPRGKVIVTTKGKTKQASNIYKTLYEPLDLDIPIIVLVDGDTTSTPRVLSGALQDFDHVVIMGSRTLGKGLVQTIRPLPYGGVTKLTTSKYYIPSGRCIQAIGCKHRNGDGSVGTVPNSLTTVLHTAAGRKVRDDGSVVPDIEVKQGKLPNILFYSMCDNLISDYATQYYLRHPSIPSPQGFEVTSADYSDLKIMMKKADFRYDQQSERTVKALREAAKFERCLDEASEEIETLEKELTHNLGRDLDYFSRDIKSMIVDEIIERYYYTRGGIIQQLKDDDELQAALKILTDPVEYKETLNASVKK